MIPKCGHGVLWSDTCNECEIIWLKYTIQDLEEKIWDKKMKLQQLLPEIEEYED